MPFTFTILQFSSLCHSGNVCRDRAEGSKQVEAGTGICGETRRRPRFWGGSIAERERDPQYDHIHKISINHIVLSHYCP